MWLPLTTEGPPGGYPNPADVARIAQACPALQQLTMATSLSYKDYDRLHVLSSMSSLQRLELSWVDDKGVRGLAAQPACAR